MIVTVDKTGTHIVQKVTRIKGTKVVDTKFQTVPRDKDSGNPIVGDASVISQFETLKEAREAAGKVLN